MPYRDWKFRISDILAAMTYEGFVADRKTVDAVIRNFIIIGEAAVHIPDEICLAHPGIPWPDMRAMRNFVVHEYFGMSDKIVWDTIHVDLSPLPPLLQAILGENP
jgi:uncharacterized protein with HEPN domain